MGLGKFFKKLFGSKAVDGCGCDTPESCPTPEVCVETKVEVPTVEVEETKKQTNTEVSEISEKLVEVAEKVTAKDIKSKTKKKPAVEATTEVVAEKKAKPRRRRKPKPKTDEGQA